MFLHLKTVKGKYIVSKECIWAIHNYYFALEWLLLIFCNSEVMTSFPHNLVLDSQPRFGLAPSEILNLYNFLINKRIFMKLVAKCSAFVNLSYQELVKV